MKVKTANLRRLNNVGNGDSSLNRDVLTEMLKQWRQKLGYCSIFAAVPAILASQAQQARSDKSKTIEVSVAGRDARRVGTMNMSFTNRALLKRQSEFRLPHQKGSFDMLAPFAGKDDCPGLTIPGGTYTAAAPYVDSGDTTGANNTVNRISFGYYYYYAYSDTLGPDHVYSFTLTSRGANPQIQVSTPSGTYRPMIYVLEGRHLRARRGGATLNIVIKEAGAFPPKGGPNNIPAPK